MTTRGVRGISLLIVLSVLLGVGARMVYVHAHTWQWSLRPSATAPKLEFAHRNYVRGAAQPTIPEGWMERGRTMGGGTILAPPPGPSVPTVVYVRAAKRLTGYSLSGGP